jgi:hypothetical protein
VSVQIEDYTDEQMLIALADENAGGEATIRAQIDTVNLAKRYLEANPTACKVVPSHGGTKLSSRGRDGEGASHEHGSLNCIVAFLGESNWSRSKVDRVLQAATQLDPYVISVVAPIGTPHPRQTQQISMKTALLVAKVPDKKGAEKTGAAENGRRRGPRATGDAALWKMGAVFGVRRCDLVLGV